MVLTEDQLILQLKREGKFDEFRTLLLEEFKHHKKGEEIIQELKELVQDAIKNDPALLDMNPAEFHITMLKHVDRSHIYDSALRLTTSLLDSENFDKKMKEEIKNAITSLSGDKETDKPKP
ncbi:uncharacterized protein VTP21DRAFT_1731 [Calcarisporiella thermophila]|uniref:uncharacterized protein n=1 Tax=Calcarisporiella thermophila TaxID=911321 RepID=UPI0037421A82